MRRLLLLAMLALAAPAVAETVAVRSGEHGGFSRIVVAPAQRTGWRLGRSAAGYELRFDRKGIGFDLDRVFRFIPRTRLADLAAAESALALTLGCACHARAFETAAGAVVIDILPGPAPDGVRFEAPLPPVSAEQGAPGPAASYRPQPRPDPRLPLYWRDRPAVPAATPAAPAASRSLPGLPAPAAPPDPRIAGIEADLLWQLSRAAAQGLVEAPAAEPGAAAPPPDAPPEDRAPPRPPEPPAAEAQIRIHAETAIDRDAATAATREKLTAEGAACLPDRLFAFGDWGDETLPAAIQIADRRQGLVGEFDRPDPAAVEALARLHLFHGFGAEAEAVLSAFGVIPEDADILADLGRILDGRPVAAESRLPGMADCDTSAALWAVLARPSLAPADAVDHGAVLRAFSALPLPLRRHLGPPLGERLTAAGHRGAARAIRDAIARAPGGHGAALRLIEARLDLTRGDAAAAGAALAAVLAEDGPLAPEALILAVDALLAQGRAADPALTETAAALAFEHRDAEQGPALERAHVLAAASAGDFARAFAALDRWKGAPPPLRAETAAAVFGLLARTPDDWVFLRQVFARRDLLTETAPEPELRRALAGRLTTLGFPGAARNMLGSGAEATAAGALVIAQAALDEHDSQGALALLAAVEGLEAARLRGAAQRMAGAHAEAARAFAEGDAPEAAAAEAWRAGDWRAVAETGTDPQRRMAERRLASSSAAPEGAGPLARGQALLQDSIAARTAVEDLLRAHGPVAAGD